MLTWLLVVHGQDSQVQWDGPGVAKALGLGQSTPGFVC